MGADFLLYAVPQCQMSAERLRWAGQAIHDMTDRTILAHLEHEEGLTYADEEQDDACQEFRKQLIEDVEFLKDPYTCEVVDLNLSGCDRLYLFTGGMSWGDVPSEAAEIFLRLGSCEKLCRLLNRWAVEDSKRRKRELREQKGSS